MEYHKRKLNWPEYKRDREKKKNVGVSVQCVRVGQGSWVYSILEYLISGLQYFYT